MDQDKITPVILCGGSGTRLWPRSRPDRPKPFLPLIGERTMFEQTLDRVATFGRPIIVTGEALVDLVDDQLLSTEALVIVEPEAKNTAAAIALAANLLDPDDVMLVCPSDHHIGNQDAFLSAALNAATIARQGWLVCLGAVARTPEIGFGYVRRGVALDCANSFQVEQFVEKPDQATAESYVASGDYAWNTGIFVFRAGDFLAELKRWRGDLVDAVREAVITGTKSGTRFAPDPEAFATIQAESVDYAVMENTDRAATVITDMAWSDIGNWRAIHSARPQDSSGNAVNGPANLIDCQNVLVESDGPRITMIGLDNVLVVADGNEVIIALLNRSGEVADFGERERRSPRA